MIFQACDTLAEKGFKLVATCCSGANGLIATNYGMQGTGLTQQVRPLRCPLLAHLSLQSINSAARANQKKRCAKKVIIIIIIIIIINIAITISTTIPTDIIITVTVRGRKFVE